MNYTKSIFVLMSGSAAAQAMPILISPILTRLYSPREFGTLALPTEAVIVHPYEPGAA